MSRIILLLLESHPANNRDTYQRSPALHHFLHPGADLMRRAPDDQTFLSDSRGFRSCHPLCRHPSLLSGAVQSENGVENSVGAVTKENHTTF